VRGARTILASTSEMIIRRSAVSSTRNLKD